MAAIGIALLAINIILFTRSSLYLSMLLDLKSSNLMSLQRDVNSGQLALCKFHFGLFVESPFHTISTL